MGTHFLIGLRTDNFVILAADRNMYMYGALKLSKGFSLFLNESLNFLEYERDYKLGKRLYMICGGESGDMDSFATWAKANIDLYERYEMRPHAVQHWLRKSMAENLRSEDMWRVNCIIGGYDLLDKTTFMSMMDHYATNLPCQDYIFSGFPGNFGYAIMDNLYKPGISFIQNFLYNTNLHIIF
ncbi:unnamed protein product [Meloidogyne enterolobii]|uniref:Uncharacterized protein n=1 Tax=Meloidogyne enterolobii TaxID=390850 RepID=A0ACB0ZNY0_MELEN